MGIDPAELEQGRRSFDTTSASVPATSMEEAPETAQSARAGRTAILAINAISHPDSGRLQKRNSYRRNFLPLLSTQMSWERSKSEKQPKQAPLQEKYIELQTVPASGTV